MSLMTREDILRELELLPVWQLRAPLPSFLDAEVVSEVEVQPAALPIAENQIIERKSKCSTKLFGGLLIHQLLHNA